MQGLWFDARYINPNKPDGISRFSLGLIRELAKLTELSALVSSDKQARLLPASVKTLKVNPPTSALEAFLGLRLRNQAISVLFSPMQTTYALGRNFKLISTLHDLIYYRHRTPPEGFNIIIKLIWLWYHSAYWPQRIVLNFADEIVTVSETTKHQMIEHRLTKRKITVIHNAAEPCEFVERINRAASRDLIYMGSFIGYKNVETLIRGMGLLPDHRLILPSRISERRHRQLTQLAKSVGANVSFLNGVTDQRYFELLRSSKALVSASLDEGFGIPLVEAMERGTPVITSDIEIFEEVAGEAGLRFHRFDHEEFAQRVLELSDETRWQELAEKALRQAEGFTWEKSAGQLLELARKLAS